MLWAPVLHSNAGLCLCLLSAYFKPFICASQEGWQRGWLPTKSTLEWEISFGNIALVAVEEAVEHGQGVIIDLKKCVLAQRHIASKH